MREPAHSKPPSVGVMAQLALADLRADLLANVCLVFSLAAAIAPLLVLFALKSGVIGAMRAELVGDPYVREIRPTETRNFDDAFFTALGARGDVAFVTPGVTRGASAVRVRSEAGGGAILDLLPSGRGDALLNAYGLVTPDRDCAVLTARAAADLGGVMVGEGIVLQTTRRVGGREERAEHRACVAGILPDRGDPLARVYVPLDVAVDIELFREGFGVPVRGWPGDAPVLPPALDGVFVVTDQPLSAVVRAELSLVSGFVLVDEAQPADVRGVFAAGLDGVELDGRFITRLSVVERGVSGLAVKRAGDRLQGFGAELLPYVDRVQVSLGAGGRVFPMVLMDGVLERPDVDQMGGWPAAVVVPSRSGLKVGDEVALRLHRRAAGGESNVPVAVPARVVAVQDGDAVGLELWAAARLRRAMDVEGEFDARANALMAKRVGFRGFRLYANTIDDVSILVEWLRARDVSVVAQVQAIERVRTLDAGLSTVFWVFAVLTVIGAGVAMMANVYGDVERKRAALGHMRLLGVTRGGVALFPVIQASVLAVLASVAAFGVAAAGAWLMNTYLARPLGFDGSVAVLSASVGGVAVVSALAVGILASGVAAWRTSRIDPGEAIRYE